MNGWYVTKRVLTDMNAAWFLAKDGKKKAARDHLKHARNLLVKYCKDEKHPEHGFKAEEIGS